MKAREPARVTELKQELIVFKRPPSLADVEQARKICLGAKLEKGILSNPCFLQTLADICSWWAIGRILTDAPPPREEEE